MSWTRPIRVAALRSGVAQIINDIGLQGTEGFGVGIAPVTPSGFTAMSGYDSPSNANYGNYQYSDGSIMVWVPAFYYRIASASSPRYAAYGLNAVDILPASAFSDVAAANASGYALHRAFYDGGAVQPGVFVDKYLCSNNAGTASSVAMGNPLSTNSSHNPISGLTGSPANAYYGVIAAAKTRGAQFFPSSRFIFSALGLLSLAHGQAVDSTVNCAWYDGVNIGPKGCNNNSLGDINDGALTFVSDGYSSSAKTGSANQVAKTAHNGQSSGVIDLNGTLWEITLGLSSDGTNIYALKTSAAMKDLTDGVSSATDAWGAAGLTALYDDFGLTAGALINRGSYVLYGNGTEQIFNAALSGDGWALTGLGVPLAGGVSGAGAGIVGQDGLWDYRPNTMCPTSGGHWSYGLPAGVWALHCYNARAASHAYVGWRAASYL